MHAADYSASGLNWREVSPVKGKQALVFMAAVVIAAALVLNYAIALAVAAVS